MSTVLSVFCILLNSSIHKVGRGVTMNQIKEILKKKSNPPWSYKEFMETALYDPDAGYYMKKTIKLGNKGDFYTSNHVHPVFQKTFGRFFVDVIRKENLSPIICEWGAGDGRFAKNILKYIKNNDEELYEHISYLIIEASPFHQAILLENLSEYKDKIKVFSTEQQAQVSYPVLEGIVFSNELIDAFPVHVVEKRNGELYEVMVDWVDDRFVEKTVLNQNKQLEDWLLKYGPELPENHRMEVCLSMVRWINNIHQWLQKGLLITVDYGYSNEELLLMERREGSLRGYYKHEMVNDPLKNPGEMDLTAHIQWDAFRKINDSNDAKEIFHDKQDKFLIHAGLFTFLNNAAGANPFSEAYKENRAIQSLVHPGGISSSFHVNVQGKGLKAEGEYKLFKEDPYMNN